MKISHFILSILMIAACVSCSKNPKAKNSLEIEIKGSPENAVIIGYGSEGGAITTDTLISDNNHFNLNLDSCTLSQRVLIIPASLVRTMSDSSLMFGESAMADITINPGDKIMVTAEKGEIGVRYSIDGSETLKSKYEYRNNKYQHLLEQLDRELIQFDSLRSVGEKVYPEELYNTRLQLRKQIDSLIKLQ